MPVEDQDVRAEQFGAPPADGNVSDEVGLCLSGGGYKAALFHLGALIRLNQLGALQKVDRISSVSGGSITSAWLGLNWEKLTFDAQGVATNFDVLIRQPIETFCRTAKLDVRVGLSGLLNPFRTSGEDLARAYDKLLFKGATLQNLPDPKKGAPTFVINATNMQLNSLWRFSRVRAADHKVGELPSPNISLAKAVAASSGFPPFFSPVVFDFAAGALKPWPKQPPPPATYLRRAVTADGGIYDNLGLETVWKRCRTVLVSNAGDPFDDDPAPPTDWPRQLQRTISTMHRQCENHRMRWLVAMANNGQRQVAAWALRSRAGAFGAPGAIALSEADAVRVGQVGVRLKPPERGELELVVRHGYSMADASVRRFWLPGAPPPVGWP